ncbi:hypothetical protein GCM10027535_21130 [Mycolicibacterium hippocampi]|uniref:Uncharacterized protein n=1 Tax=Mycolicibacterium hippocampi TaxID=659824 RepID=A0A7I9ZH80_9MYCO|nr:hypothetical protein MHIP_06860 [Mycolicibacterium hippocampi]
MTDIEIGPRGSGSTGCRRVGITNGLVPGWITTKPGPPAPRKSLPEADLRYTSPEVSHICEIGLYNSASTGNPQIRRTHALTETL